MSTVTPLTTVAPVEVSQGMLDLADRLEEAAKLIREGKVRSGALVYVEYGPDMNVTSDWCSSSGGLTLAGGLGRVIHDIHEG